MAPVARSACLSLFLSVALSSRQKAEVHVHSPDNLVKKQVVDDLCLAYTFEYEVKGRWAQEIWDFEHPCCTQAKSCFGKEQRGNCQAECKVSVSYDGQIKTRGLETSESWWLPKTCLKPADVDMAAAEKEVHAKHAGAQFLGLGEYIQTVKDTDFDFTANDMKGTQINVKCK